MGKVPVLILDDGTNLIDSSAIADYLDEWVGAERASSRNPVARGSTYFRQLHGRWRSSKRRALCTTKKNKTGGGAPAMDRTEAAGQTLAGLDQLEQTGRRVWMFGERPGQADNYNGRGVSDICFFPGRTSQRREVSETQCIYGPGNEDSCVLFYAAQILNAARLLQRTEPAKIGIRDPVPEAGIRAHALAVRPKMYHTRSGCAFLSPCNPASLISAHRHHGRSAPPR